MKQNLIYAFGAAALLGLAMSACKPNAEAPLSAPQVSLQTIKITPLPQVIEVVGQLEGPREIEVRARVSGILFKQTYQEGAMVKEGDLLFKIDPDPYRIALVHAQAELMQADAQLVVATTEAHRQEALAKKKIGSAKDLQDAQTAAKTAQARKEAAQAKLKIAELELSYCEVRAPISGFAGKILHSEGSLVGPGDSGLLTTVVQRDTVWARFGLSEEQFKRLFEGKNAQALAAQVELKNKLGEVLPLKGKVNFVAAEVEARLGTVQMRAEFDNREAGLLPGQFIKVRVTGRTLPAAVRIPNEVILQSTRGPFVFVADEKNQTLLKLVEVDEVLGGQATVLKGLQDGDRVILDNLQRVRTGMTVAPREVPVEKK